MIWVNVVLGTVQAVATVLALYYAWKTVHEARAAEEERRLERAAERLESMSEVVANIRLSNRGTNRVMAEAGQDRLRAMVAVSPDELPATRALAEQQFTAQGYSEDETLANESLEELRAAARALAAARLGTE